jgi:chromosome partitioning protein
VLKKRIERRYVLTRFDSRRKMSWAIDQQLRERFGQDVCQTRIAENVSLAESPFHNRSVFGHAPDSRGAQDYVALLDELQTCDFLS